MEVLSEVSGDGNLKPFMFEIDKIRMKKETSDYKEDENCEIDNLLYSNRVSNPISVFP